MSSLYRTERDRVPTISITDKCIVLDLDNTLICTADEGKENRSLISILNSPTNFPIHNRLYCLDFEDYDRPGEGTTCSMLGVRRPYLDQFLYFCFAYFKVVAVWSAGTKPYVDAVVNEIFADIQPPHIVFSRDETERRDKRTVKPLQKLYDANEMTRRYMNPRNTLIVDDLSSNFEDNLNNGILIPGYQPSFTTSSINQNDESLKQLVEWFSKNEIKMASDVRTLNKAQIFIN